MNVSYEIYLITTPGYWYVGSSFGKLPSSGRRFNQHMSGRGCAPKLWAKIQEIGKGSFKQTVVEKGSGNPIEAESRWYDFYLAHDARETLNLCRPTDSGMLGRHHTEETKEKIRKGNLGKRNTPEAIARMREIHKGFTHSLESRAKMSVRMMGNNWNLGKVLPKETRIKMSESHKGKIPVQNFMKVACGNCEMITNPGSMGKHFKATGHSYA